MAVVSATRKRRAGCTSSASVPKGTSRCRRTVYDAPWPAESECAPTAPSPCWASKSSRNAPHPTTRNRPQETWRPSRPAPRHLTSLGRSAKGAGRWTTRTFASGTIVELCRIRRAGHCVGDLPSYCYYGLLLSHFCWPGNGNCHNPSHSAWRDQPLHERGLGGQHLHAVATAAC